MAIASVMFINCRAECYCGCNDCPLHYCALQLAYVEHHLGQPLSCLAPAAASGSRRKLHAAIKALPPGHLWRCCQALTASVQAGTAAAAATSSADASAGSNSASSAAEVTAAQDAALAHLQGALEGNQGSRRGQGTGPASEASSAAAAVLEGAVWGAMTAFQQWRVGLLMLDLVAKFTGALITVRVVGDGLLGKHDTLTVDIQLC